MSPFKFLFGLLLVGVLHAEPCSVLQLGGSYTRANIQIESQPSFNGNLGGIQGSYEYKPCTGFYGGLRTAWKQGKTENSFATRKLVYVDVQERVGYTFSCFTFFSGFGYRYLGHTLNRIKFKYNEFYIPVGFLSEYYFSSCLSLGLNFTWMPQVLPTVEIIPLKGARWILKSMTGNVSVELPLTYSLNHCYCLIFKPFYERWADGRSTAKTSCGCQLGLPKNTYNFWGAELNLGYSF